MIKDDMKNVIIGDEYIEDEQEREEKIATLCDAAIVDACAEIDGYLAKRYRLPLRKVPQVINKFAKDISVYNLVSRTGIDESEREKTFLNRYNAAIKFLLDVAKGTISIGVEDIGGGSEAANGFKMKSSGRVFSRESMKALWASLCTLANDFLTKYKRPLYFVCEARGKTAGETLEEYANAMLEERKGINNMYMQVVCSNSRYQRMDGRVQDINNAGIVTGLYGQAKESQSIGEVKSFPISEAKMLKLLPEGIEDYIKTLDDAKYVTIRKYISKEDFYVTSANMMSPEGSDYAYAEDVRVSNRLVKAVRAAALDELQVEIDPGDIETSIANIQEQLATPVEDAVRDKIISSGTVAIDTENLNILVDESLDVRITYVPMGHVREMNLTFAVENPYAAS